MLKKFDSLLRNSSVLVGDFLSITRVVLTAVLLTCRWARMGPGMDCRLVPLKPD